MAGERALHRQRVRLRPGDAGHHMSVQRIRREGRRLVGIVRFGHRAWQVEHVGGRYWQVIWPG